MRTHWKRKTVQDEPYNGACLEEVDDLVDLIKNADYKKNKEQKEIEELQMKMFSSRKLLNGEVKVLLDYLALNAQQVEMSIDNIDDWAYDKNFVGKLSHYVGKAALKIKYQDSNNIEKAIDRIERGHNVTEYKKCRHGYFLCWKYDEKYEVYGIPIEREVINKDTSCRTKSNIFKFRVKQNVVPHGQKILAPVLADVQFSRMNVVENIFLSLPLKMNVRRLYIGSITEEYLWK